LTADAPKYVNICENHNTLRSWTTSHQILQNNFKDNTLSIKDLQPVYDFPVALTKDKKKDLLDMCMCMPQQYSDFYTSLPG